MTQLNDFLDACHPHAQQVILRKYASRDNYSLFASLVENKDIHTSRKELITLLQRDCSAAKDLLIDAIYHYNVTFHPK
ncbi:MAG: hypothetical protein GY821_07035 [Gammaproteobacteria bacterium]|nr:hypothetical protein [Gammaproteobacteria bacterium]